MGYFSRRVSLEKHEFSFGWYKLRWTVCSQVQFWMIQITMDSVFTGSVSDDTNYNGQRVHVFSFGRYKLQQTVCSHTLFSAQMEPLSHHTRQQNTDPGFGPFQTMELVDVYCFGQLLFEMTFGCQLNTATCDNFPQSCPAQIRES